MKRTPETNQITSLFQRWERMERQRKDLSDDLKDLFAEAKGFGLNTKALRAVFVERFRDETMTPEQRSKAGQNEADMDLYRMALEGSPSHACEADPETGEITEPQVAPQPAQSHAATRGSATEPDGRSGDESPVNNPAAKASVGNGATGEPAKVAADSVTGDASRPSRGGGTPVTNSPETATKQRVNVLPQHEVNDCTGAGIAVEGQATVQNAGVTAGETAPSNIINLDRTETREERCLRLRPHCQNPSKCGSSVWNEHCYSCSRAISQGGAA